MEQDLDHHLEVLQIDEGQDDNVDGEDMHTGVSVVDGNLDNETKEPMETTTESEAINENIDNAEANTENATEIKGVPFEENCESRSIVSSDYDVQDIKSEEIVDIVDKETLGSHRKKKCNTTHKH